MGTDKLDVSILGSLNDICLEGGVCGCELLSLLSEGDVILFPDNLVIGLSGLDDGSDDRSLFTPCIHDRTLSLLCSPAQLNDSSPPYPSHSSLSVTSNNAVTKM